METAAAKLVNRSPAPLAPVHVATRAAPATPQFASTLRVSSPADPAEREAESTARRVMSASAPRVSPFAAQFDGARAALRARNDAPTAAREPAGMQLGAGEPLPTRVRAFMEPRFGADFRGVRVHTGEAAARSARALNAHAFTIGGQIAFAKGKFQPDASEGRELIAHELTHTIQQGAVIQRSAAPPITAHSEVHAQRLGISDALDYFADKANAIPGFRMFTLVLGVNPINMSRVERSGANVIRAVVEFMPGGFLITQALDAYGVIEKAGAFVEQQLRSLGMTGALIKNAISEFLDSLGWRDIFDLGGVWTRAKRIFTEPIDRMKSFVVTLATTILTMIREAVLRPLAKLAEGTRGYDLLKAVLGQDPVTGDPVPRTAETLIAGFMKLIGREDVWENIQKGKAIPRAWAWFQTALAGLLGFVRQVPALFMSTLRSLEIMDLVLLPRAFAKVGAAFGSFLGQFLSWAGGTIWALLEIVFDVVAPAAMPYLRKAAGAFRLILANPVGFVGNLVRAGKQGFLQFADKFGSYLKKSMIEWLTGAMSGAAIYIPQSFAFMELAKFVLSVLGLTWQNVRAKLVKATSETVVKALETGFELVVILVRDGPGAAWEKIKEHLSNLKEMVFDEIQNFVVVKVVQSAITKLITSLNPAGAVIQAIIATYNTIMFFVERIKQIIQVVTAFIDSISAIANGVIAAAANRVESTLAGLLTLAISFLARIVGLGKVSDVVVNIVNKIRAPIDKALDKVVDFIVTGAKKIGGFLASKAKAAFSWAFAKKTFRDANDETHSILVNDSADLMIASNPQAAKAFVVWYAKENKLEASATAPVLALIDQAITEARAIGVAAKAKETAADISKDPPAADRQQKLLLLMGQISAGIAGLVGDDRDIGVLEQKYLLEGQVGTYAEMPKPVGDKLTPDHQPQASVILAAADFFKDELGIEGGPLADRAKSRAAQGWAINLHFNRHIKGATYGSKGKTRAGFTGELKTKIKTRKPADAKPLVSDLLRAELKKDVIKMREVANTDVGDDIWKDLRELLKSKKPKQISAFKGKIAARIHAGLNQVGSQPLDF